MSRRALRPLTPVVAAFAVLLASPVAAQPSQPTSYGLKLETSREIANGRIAIVQATAGAEPAQSEFNPPGSPEIPSSCDESRPGGCESCYADAYDKLNRVRFNLERLRAIRGSTEEFYRASVSFGDNVSGIHGVAGLAWQAERRKIEQSFKRFQGSYVKKHTQLMGDLKGALDAIALCEAKYYNNPDWYNRFGFMYYGFMESRYAW